jgi:hypothetical protein
MSEEIIDSMIVEIGADLSEFDREMKRADGTMQKTVNNLQRGARGAYEATRRMSNGIDEVSNSADDASDSVDELGEAFSLSEMSANAMLTGVKALGMAIVGLGAVGVKASQDLSYSMKLIDARLGTTTKEAEKLSDATRDIYADGFGDSLVGIAKDMTAFKMITKTSGEPLNDIIKKAETLREVFDVELQDSARALQPLMRNFGLTGAQSIDLMTKGFQLGGDYSGDLLDTLQEYSPYFKTLGMDAGQMLGVLISGAEAGARNLDYVGDAVKEFGIRAKDGSKSTSDGFKAIGLNADKMALKVAKGGKGATEAFEQTINALAKMKDPVQRNIHGVELFGTKFEDLEWNVVSAMRNGVKGVGEFEGATQRAMDILNSVLGSKVEAFGRGIYLSLGNAFKPAEDSLNKFVDAAIARLPEIDGALAKTGASMGESLHAIDLWFVANSKSLRETDELITTVSDSVGVATNAIEGTIQMTSDAVFGTLGAAVQVVGGIAKSEFQSMTFDFDGAVDTWKKSGEEFGEDMKDVFTDLIDSSVNLGMNITKNISNAFGVGLDNVRSKIAEYQYAVKSFFGLTDDGGGEPQVGARNGATANKTVNTDEPIAGSRGRGKIPAYANGGFVSGAQFAMVGEDGPEAIIPLSPSRRGRAMSLYMETGKQLGMPMFADGGFTKPLSMPTSQSAPSAVGSSPIVLQIAEGAFQFTVQSQGISEGVARGIFNEELGSFVSRVEQRIANS